MPGGHEGFTAPTLYPEALTCSPLLVRVDFMRTKKERSCARLEGAASVGLGSGRTAGPLRLHRLRHAEPAEPGDWPALAAGSLPGTLTMA